VWVRVRQWWARGDGRAGKWVVVGCDIGRYAIDVRRVRRHDERGHDDDRQWFVHVRQPK
jgi:hypothetical protein